MISQACQWTQSPSATPLQPIKYMLLFGLCSLMISQAGWWTRTPSATSLQPKKMKSSFLYYIQLLMLARLVDGLKPHPPPVSSQKNEMLIFVLHWTSDDKPGWLMDLNPICHPSPDKKMNAHIWIMFNFWWSARLVNGLKPHLPPVSSQKNKMLIFGLCSTSDDQSGWLRDSNPIHHLSPPKKMKCSFLDYVQLLMIGRAGQWTETPSATPLQPITWNATFWITFNFWWSAGLVNGLKPHPPPLSSQNSEMLIFVLHSTCDVGQTGQWTWTSSTTPLHPKKWNGHFGLCSTSDDWLGWSMDWNSLCHPSPAKNMKCYFLDYIQLLMIGWAGQWTQTPSSIPLQPKQWNAHFCITFNMWCWPDWSMDLNLIHHPSAPKKMKCSFWIMFNFWWSARLLYGLKPIFHLSPAKKWNAYFWITFNFWWLAGLLDGLEPGPPPISSLKIEMLIFWLCSTSDDRLCWSMDSNPSHHCSPAKK